MLVRGGGGAGVLGQGGIGVLAGPATSRLRRPVCSNLRASPNETVILLCPGTRDRDRDTSQSSPVNVTGWRSCVVEKPRSPPPDARIRHHSYPAGSTPHWHVRKHARGDDPLYCVLCYFWSVILAWHSTVQYEYNQAHASGAFVPSIIRSSASSAPPPDDPSPSNSSVRKPHPLGPRRYDACAHIFRWGSIMPEKPLSALLLARWGTPWCLLHQ